MQRKWSYNPDGLLWLYGVREVVTPSSMQWDYDYYQSGIDDLVKADLAVPVDGNFYSIFDGWLEQVNDGVDKRQLLKDAETWKHVLSSAFVRTSLFTPALIKFLYRDNEELIADDGFHYPTIVCLVLSLKATDSKLLPYLADAGLLTLLFQKIVQKEKLNLDWFKLADARLQDAIEKYPEDWAELKPLIAGTVHAKNYSAYSAKIMATTLQRLKYLTPEGAMALMSRYTANLFGKFKPGGWK